MRENENKIGVYPANSYDIQNSASCHAHGTHFALVSVPVTVKPFAHTGCVTVSCGEPAYVNPGEFRRGRTDEVCHFTISQLLKIEIPVDFGAVVTVDEAHVDCGTPGVDCGCNDNNHGKDDCECDDKRGHRK